MSNKPQTIDTKEDGKRAQVPKLRFPEFREMGGWGESTVDEVIMTVTPPMKLQTSDYRMEGQFPIVDQSQDSICGWTDNADAVIDTGLPVIVFGDHTCALKFVDHPFAQGADGIKILKPKHGISPRFLFFALEANPVVQESYKRHFAVLKEKKIVFPDSKSGEQQKIAECLSSADEGIAAQTRKVEALKAHKKGLMLQLFPQEGETQPRLRFPEFEGTGEWCGGELGPNTEKVGSGITPSGGDRNYKSSGRPFVRSQNVGWGELILDDVAFLDEETHNSFASTEIRLGDVLLNITGASIGRSAVADTRIVGGNVNQHVCIIRVKPEALSREYLSQFLISQIGQRQIDSFQAGGNRQGLNFAQIRSFYIPVPPKISEQQYIADCLTSLDDLIAAETRKLDTLKTHKKGLTQQLFPVPDEAEA